VWCGEKKWKRGLEVIVFFFIIGCFHQYKKPLIDLYLPNKSSNPDALKSSFKQRNHQDSEFTIHYASARCVKKRHRFWCRKKKKSWVSNLLWL
jgi:hypothetical protein